jgi:hypothetical protein
MKVNKLIRLVTFLVVVSSFSACYDITLWKTESDYESCVDDKSVMVGVDIIPNPVIAGDSVSFTCNMIFDKDAWNITYFWQPDTSNLILTNDIVENYYKTVAPTKPGTYVGSVFVNYQIGDWGCDIFYGKDEYFPYEVIPKK